jgi:hypothetical protein
MENAFASYEGISACWIEKCTFISGIVAMARLGLPHQRADPAGVIGASRDGLIAAQVLEKPFTLNHCGAP